MAYWLIKSEPGVFSIDDLAKAPGRRTQWEGVRNYQARNNLRAMRKGDRCLFYHSNAAPSAVAGVAEVAREAYPDPHQFDAKSKYHDPKSSPTDPRWSLVDVKFVRRFETPVPLDAIKRDPKLKAMVLVNNSRLSVQPVTPAEFDRVLALASAS